MRKIAIIGKCSNSKGDAPIHDASWEIWGLAWDPLPVCHRYFEMHQNWRQFRFDPKDPSTHEDCEVHRRWMMGLTVPIYMLKKEDEIPYSVEFPMDDVAKLIGRTRHGTPYIESSIAYMMALALFEKPDRIGIWGCDLATGGEYAYQRPNMEYLIGLGRGMGINVYTPAKNALLSPLRHVPYGYDPVPEDEPEKRPDWMPKLEPPQEQKAA